MIILANDNDLIGRNIERYFLLKILNTPEVFMVHQFKDKSILILGINSFNATSRALTVLESTQLLVSLKDELLAHGVFSPEDLNTLAINLQKEIERKEAVAKAKAERYQTYLELKKEFEPEFCKSNINLTKEQQNNIKDTVEHLIRS